MQRFRARLQILWVALVLLSAGRPADVRAESFSTPARLAPRVEFWKRIYTEVGTEGGFVHDAEDLAIVYETIRFPKDLSQRARDRRLRKRKEFYKVILEKLARGRRTNLSADEKRVLALFPQGTTNKTLRAASRRVRFQLGQADKFRQGLVRMGRWEDYIHRVLAERGLPTELVALPHVESSFNPEARSHVGAAGMWQFTRSTGRLYMRVDHVVDERRDPFLSTVAAARLLKTNYEKTGTWPLAITAYNHGAAGMQRAIRKLGTRDIATIVERYKSRSFGFASRNFYSEFLAALDVERHPERYFGTVKKDPPQRPEIVVLDHYYKARTLADVFGLGLERLRRENPALLQPIWHGQKYVPKGYGLRVPPDPARGAPKVALARIPAGQRFSRQVPDRTYRVKRGDTLSTIARRFGVGESELVALNGLRSRHRIVIGQTLKLPVHGADRKVASVADPAAVPEPIPADGIYRVRRGDNLHSIARRFGVSEQDLAAENRLRNRNVIHVGQVLQIPGGARSAHPGDTDAGVYVVGRGDTLYQIARRFGISEAAIMKRNGLQSAHRIQAGQRLYIPAAVPGSSGTPAAPAPAPERAEAERTTPESASGDSVASAGQTRATAPTAEPRAAGLPTGREGPEAPAALPLSPERYRVAEDGSIRVQPDETLGHLSDWLEVAPGVLRQRNGLMRGQPLPLGGRLQLDWSRVARETFEARRVAHHRALQQDFYGSFSVSGVREVVLRRGDTLWKVAETNGSVPVWLLLEYNPGVEAGALHPGQRVRVPRVQARPAG